MEITGRLTADAQVKKLKDNRELVAFCIAINDSYKNKDGEKKDETTFINCSYWITTKIADSLKKGSIVTLFGRIGQNTYKDMDGDVHSYLTFHVNNIKIVQGKKSVTHADVSASTKEDLPF